MLADLFVIIDKIEIFNDCIEKGNLISVLFAGWDAL